MSALQTSRYVYDQGVVMEITPDLQVNAVAITEVIRRLNMAAEFTFRPVDENTPRDGTPIIAIWLHLGTPVVAWMSRGGVHKGANWVASHSTTYKSAMYDDPDLWMPMPALPTEETGPIEETTHGRHELAG